MPRVKGSIKQGYYRFYIGPFTCYYLFTFFTTVTIQIVLRHIQILNFLCIAHLKNHEPNKIWGQMAQHFIE